MVMELHIATSPEIDFLVASGVPVAIGVSGGKDSSAVAVATCEYLDLVGHSGPRILIHSHLGATEWDASLPMCRSLAETLGLELVVVRRKKGDMMDRWEQRWADNVTRYAELSCVKLILPWSTPDMRFCTSELKTAIICQGLIERFPGETILSVSGIRRQESSRRAKAPVAKPQAKLTSKTKATSGFDWHPIIDWSLEDVYACLKRRGISLHEAYTTYGLSRVSCRFCIMQSAKDMQAAAKAEESHSLYRRMVALEVASTFAFHGDTWLGDVATHLLDSSTVEGLRRAKENAIARQDAESDIPSSLLFCKFCKGWPTRIPTPGEAQLLCDVRRKVAAAVGLDIRFTDPALLVQRYQELWEAKHGAMAA